MMTADKDFKRLVRERATRTGESYVTARRHLLRRRQEEIPLTDQLVPVVFVGVILKQFDELQVEQFWMLLREQGGRRELLVEIGPAEAGAISMGAQRVNTQRPMTHDTLKQAVDAFGGRPARIEIGSQPGGSIFTADLLVERKRGDPIHFDCRPSDAVALAVRYEPPPEILVHNSLLEEAAASGE